MATVNIAQGKLKGGEVMTHNGFKYYEFIGIPYAKPPVGPLRFKSPQTADPWENERNADSSAYDINNTALQVSFMNKSETSGSEDCLYLNVYTPKLYSSNTELLPVMVYIHGGGFVVGNGTNKTESGPDSLIQNDVIVVAINYRLGVFGFLSLDIPEAAGNMGLKDQVKALQWVQSNISQFGGDKHNVTIFGVSAGSASIEYLLLSSMAKGLFHKAILQSGSTLNDWAINYEPRKLLANLLKGLGYTGSMQDNYEIHQYLLNVPASHLVRLSFEAMENFTTEKLYFGFVPTIEKKFSGTEPFLTECPYKLLKEGNFIRVPLIRGFCQKEGTTVTCVKPLAVKALLDKKNFTDRWAHVLESIDRSKYNKVLEKVYTENINQKDDEWTVDFIGDADFTAGIWTAGKMMSTTGLPIYMYKFSYCGELNITKLYFNLNRHDAGHGDDLLYVVNNDQIQIPSKITERDRSVRHKVTKMWTNFAKNGNPTPEDCEELPVKWPRFTRNAPLLLNIDKEITIESDHDPKTMAVFEEIYGKYIK